MESQCNSSNQQNVNDVKENILKTKGFYGESKFIKQKIEELSKRLVNMNGGKDCLNYDEMKKNN